MYYFSDMSNTSNLTENFLSNQRILLVFSVGAKRENPGLHFDGTASLAHCLLHSFGVVEPSQIKFSIKR